jgi:predicted RNase H-like HicB family nuclease
MDLIREIEEYCGVDFNGETRDEASDFIDEWIMELQDRKADERNFFRDN